MNQNKLSFAGENLVVDYISFNISGLVDPEPIANYLSDFGFNSILKSKEKTRAEVLISQSENYHKVTFVKSNYDPGSKSYWKGLIVRFSGEAGNYFYQLIRKKLIDWDIFDLASPNLGRFDLHFLRDFSESESREELALFMENSCQKVKYIFPKTYAEYFVRKKGLILEVGSRVSSHRLRVYEKKNSLEFELEIKTPTIDSLQNYFFNHQFDSFEYKLTKIYYEYSQKLFPLDNFYVEWLVHFRRKYQSKKILKQSYLFTNYLENKITLLEDKKRFYHFIQFLTFIKTLNYENSKRHWIKEKCFYIQQFYLSNFLEFVGIKVTRQNQRKKLLEYFEKLHKIEPIVEEFSDRSFRTYACFPFSGVNKTKTGRWIVEVYIIEDLLLYEYPFILSNSFLSIKNKSDLSLKSQLMRSLTVHNQQKTFNLQELFSQISVSNTRMIEIKKDLIQLLQELNQQQRIKSKLQLISKDGKENETHIQNLTTSALNRRIHYLKFSEII